jgi:hypothetical protein
MVPVFRQPTFMDTEKVDELNLHLISGGWQAPLLAPVDATECLAGDHEVAFGNLLVDLHRGVRECRQEPGVVALEGRCRPVTTRPAAALGSVMVHEFWMEYGVRCRQVVLVLAQLDIQARIQCRSG